MYDIKTIYIAPDSCRRVADRWVVAMNKWQTLTDMEVNQGQYNKRGKGSSAD